MIWLEKAKAAYKWELFTPKDPGSGDANSIGGLLDQVISLILMIAGALAVIYLIYSGILYITAAGNPDQAKKGQQGVINAVIGIVIIVAVYFIVRVAMGLGEQFTG
jgi:hypothetical protein